MASRSFAFAHLPYAGLDRPRRADSDLIIAVEPEACGTFNLTTIRGTPYSLASEFWRSCARTQEIPFRQWIWCWFRDAEKRTNDLLGADLYPRNPARSRDHQLPLRAQFHAAYGASVRHEEKRQRDFDDAVSRRAQTLFRPFSRQPPPDAARGFLGAMHRVLSVRDRLPRAVHIYRGGRVARSARREISGALRNRHAALHLLRAVRRGVPVRRDSDGHLRSSAHLGLRPQGFRRAEGTADASLARAGRERPRRQHERDARVVSRAGRRRFTIRSGPR